MDDDLAAEINDLASRLWPRVIREIDELSARGQTGVRSVPSNTSLATDDHRTRPFQTSHAVQQCLVAGIDSLSGLRRMIFGAPGSTPEAVTVHQAAHYLLARGAIENFATGLWILGPSSRAERVTRTMRWHAQNVKDMHSALDPLPVESSRTSRDQKVERLEQILRESGCVVPPGFRGGYTTTEAVRYVDDLLDPNDRMLTTLFVWKLCSGFAHGRPWASLGFLEREEIETDDPDIVHARMTSDLPRALMAPQHALELCSRLLTIYESRTARIEV